MEWIMKEKKFKMSVNIKVWMYGSLDILCVFGSTAWIGMMWLLNILIVIKIIGWETDIPDCWIF